MSFVTILVSSLLSVSLALHSSSEIERTEASSVRATADEIVAQTATQDHVARGSSLSPTGQRIYLDVAGQPLPFSSDDEILEFLEQANVTTVKKIATGINGALKVRLERDGVAAHGVFRTVARAAIKEHSHGAPAVRDHYVFEKAAYELARRLGVESIPATVVRRVDGRQGTLQLWIENAVGGTDLLFVDDRPTWHQLRDERREMRLFDALVHNFDRHLQNVLVDEGGHIWLIDHTRTFPATSKLKEPESITYDADFAERLRALTSTELRKTVKPFLKGHELQALTARRKSLLRHLDKLQSTADLSFEGTQVASHQED